MAIVTADFPSTTVNEKNIIRKMLRRLSHFNTLRDFDFHLQASLVLDVWQFIIVRTDITRPSILFAFRLLSTV